MSSLSRNTETVLLAIWKLRDNAYGLSIIEQVEQDAGAKMPPGAIYGILTRLKKNGWIKTATIGPASGQVGRPRVYYELTPLGLKELVAAQEAVRSVWGGVPDLEKAG